MPVLTIGQLAKATGMGIDAIRFYEKEGLVPPPPRRASGYREYSHETVARIRFVSRAKELGFSLREIRELLALRQDSKRQCRDVELRAEGKLADIETKMKDLARIRNALKKLKKNCGESLPLDRCPIIASFESERSGDA